MSTTKRTARAVARAVAMAVALAVVAATSLWWALSASAEEGRWAESAIRGGISVQKVDADTGEGAGQGDASLKGTTFAVYSQNANPIQAYGKMWNKGDEILNEQGGSLLVTDENGWAQTGPRDLPYGDYIVKEVAAGEGYRAAGQRVQIRRDGVIVRVGQDFENEVKRGGVTVRKVDADTGAASPQGDATLSGTKFTITNASGAEVVVNGITYQVDDVVMTIETGTDGVATTGPDALPYGTYTVREQTPPQGYLQGDAAFSQTVVIREDQKVYELDAPFSNAVARGGLSLVKQDAETYGTPQGAAQLSGAAFEVVNRSAHDVVVGGQTYKPGQVVVTLETDEAGQASTADDALPYGTYGVRESAAPNGYNAGDGTEQTVVVREAGTVVACDAPFRNSVMRGGFGLRKFDSEVGKLREHGSASYDPTGNSAQGDATLAGATFEVTTLSANPVVVGGKTYNQGEVVATIVTDEGGWAQVGSRDLPYGTYQVREVVAPTGYHAGKTDADGVETDEGTTFEVTVSSQGWWTSYEYGEATDQVVRGGISLLKVDADTGKPAAQGDASLEGATFEIVNRSAGSVTVDGTSHAPGQVVKTIVTDADGRAQTGSRDLPYGTYEVRESGAPTGYFADESTVKVEVREEGVVVALESNFSDAVKRGGISVQKVDAETGEVTPQGKATFEGAVFSISNASQAAVVFDGESYAPGVVVTTITTGTDGRAQTGEHALPYGTYTVREVSAPAGYLLSQGTCTVEVREDGVVMAASWTEPAQAAEADAQGQSVEADGEQGQDASDGGEA